MNISDQDIQNLHKKYAASELAYTIIYTHSLIIREIALQIVNRNHLNINTALVETGALLHDIGAYKLVNAAGVFNKKEYIKHGIYGYEMLRTENLPEELCRIASHHTGVGITRDEISQKKLPLPLDDYTADSIEEKIIMYADKFHSKTPQFNTFESYKSYISRFGNEKVKQFEQLASQFGIPKLDDLANKYNMPLI